MQLEPRSITIRVRCQDIPLISVEAMHLVSGIIEQEVHSSAAPAWRDSE